MITISYKDKFDLSIHVKRKDTAEVESILRDNNHLFETVQFGQVGMFQITVFDVTIKKSCIIGKLIKDKNINLY